MKKFMILLAIFAFAQAQTGKESIESAQVLVGALGGIFGDLATPTQVIYLPDYGLVIAMNDLLNEFSPEEARDKITSITNSLLSTINLGNDKALTIYYAGNIDWQTKYYLTLTFKNGQVKESLE